MSDNRKSAISEVVSLTQSLVRIKSITGRERKLSYFVRDYLRTCGIETRIDSFGNIIARIRGQNKKSPVILLNTHMDTVSVSPDTWTVPPFSGDIYNDLLYGRGAVDAKGSLAAMLVAMKQLTILKHPPSVLFTAVVNEEAKIWEKRKRGILNIIAKDECRDVNAAIVGEATSLNLGTGHRGRVLVDIELKGRQCHSSMPQNGLNAASHFTHFFSYLDNRAKDLCGRNPKKAITISQCSPQENTRQLTLFPEIAPMPSANPCHLPKWPGTTFELVNWRSGKEANVIPDSCQALLECRYPASITSEKVIDFINDSFAKYCSRRTALKALTMNIRSMDNSRKPFLTASHLPYANLSVRRALSVLQKLNLQAKEYTNSFYTDAGFIADKLNIPVFVIGPGDESLAHSNNEHIKIIELEQSVQIYFELCRAMASILGPTDHSDTIPKSPRAIMRQLIIY